MRNLRILGLSLIVAFALSAVLVSAASATAGTFTGGPEVHGIDTSGKEGAKHSFTGATAFGCESATYEGEATGSVLELTPILTNCSFSFGAPMTVTPNGCKYRITLGTPQGHTAPATLSLACEGGNQMIFDLYQDEGHTQEICKVEVPGQGPLFGGLTVHDQTNGHLRATGTIIGITNYLAGPCVDGGTVNLGSLALHVDMTLGEGLGIH